MEHKTDQNMSQYMKDYYSLEKAGGSLVQCLVVCHCPTVPNDCTVLDTMVTRDLRWAQLEYSMESVADQR